MELARQPSIIEEVAWQQDAAELFELREQLLRARAFLLDDPDAYLGGVDDTFDARRRGVI